MRALQRHKENQKRQIEGIEYYLMDAFSPVAPSQDFVSDLKSQLSTFSIITPIPPAQIGRYTLLAIIAVIGGGVFFAVLIRYLIAFVALIGLMRQKQERAVVS